MASLHFDLSPLEFRDALSLRYGRPMVRMPPVCDGCGVTSSVIRRHNEILDSLGFFVVWLMGMQLGSLWYLKLMLQMVHLWPICPNKLSTCGCHTPLTLI